MFISNRGCPFAWYISMTGHKDGSGAPSIRPQEGQSSLEGSSPSYFFGVARGDQPDSNASGFICSLKLQRSSIRRGRSLSVGPLVGKSKTRRSL